LDIFDEITQIVGPEQLFRDPVECLCYSRDMSAHQGIPNAVVLARSTEQVSHIMELALRERIPVTPRGTGTSVTGAVLPVRGGLLLNLHLMNKILESNKEDFYARLGPDVICKQ
jgi:glycolate oxidase